ncbi:MAG: PmoA family protein [Candidatus Pedobacter colombiensis]|uniref:PmoA family protein n=1 Tax=Candidatus Pedobacter colombiensis TaxID=3121371 RepID=A0AAJ6B934_9SPHI|nr:PmoA family protein [Pedobacter sp.]WEK21514.1 MAG: PmoA family protein [Pedobacter sp.]
MKKYLILGCCFAGLQLNAQTKKVSFLENAKQQKVDVLIDGKPFTSFLYPDNLEKPILYPLQTASSLTVTRGFPLEKRGNERTDHPHHVGLWFNYESVNGLDFWNNSYNIPADKKSAYGWIRNVKVGAVKDGTTKGSLTYTANWERQDKRVLLKEATTFVFSGNDDTRTVDRTTTLTAQKDTVYFKDVKDGMLGIRVTKELELPSDKEESYTDNKGIVTKIAPTNNGANGDYLTSAGKKGNDAWGTRGNWCVLFGVKEHQPVSIAVIDHPKNPGYPTYWHARDYGLFAANPLGQAVFSNGKEQLNFTLKPGESVTFRYRVIIGSGKKQTAEFLNKQAADFAKQI